MSENYPEIVLRDAGVQDEEMLNYWDKQEHVLHSDPNDDWNWAYELPRKLPWRKLLIAEHKGRAIGFIQIIDPHEEETHYWGEVEANLRAIDIWIGDAADLGKGYGTIMMKLALEICFSDNIVNVVIIDPLETNTRAHKFYERLGFIFVENRKFDQDFCRVHCLSRETFNALREG